MPETRILRSAGSLAALGASLFSAGCMAPETQSQAPTSAASRPADDTGVAPEVLEALTAAARGTPHEGRSDPATAMTGREMTAIQAAFDVRRYALAVRVMPDTRTIDGSVDVTFAAKEPLQAIELDLDPRLEIRGATLDGAALDVTRASDRFVVALPAAMEAGEIATVKIAYGGSPHVALAPPWHGGFVWSEVDGTPWFATAVQTDGCDLWWPCKDHFADKPDEGVEVAVTAPRGVKVASVGTLAGMEEGSDGFDTWRWTSRHPYAGYAVAINGGPYEVIDVPYTGVNGTTYPVQFWALPKNVDKARTLLKSDAIPDLEFFERMLGPYPWGDEKAGFVETPHLGMEHQTINGYGEQYKRGKHGFDQLLHHELAHEWFGNVLTHARPQDSWIHEGYGSYMQAVYAEETIGRMGYLDRMYGSYVDNEHCLPFVNPDVADVGEAFANRDIYTKGAWMLHTLRNLIGEEAFWDGTRRLIYDTADPWSLQYPIAQRYRTTEDFTRIMSEEAGRDLSWLVNAYAYEAGMPELRTTRADGVMSLEWVVPGGRDFPMPVPVSVDGVVTTVDMASGSGSIAAPDGARLIIDPESTILRSLPIIGDCEEQTDVQVQYNIDRYTRMAKEYGWRRD